MKPPKHYILGYDIGDFIASALLFLVLLSAIIWGNLWMWALFTHHLTKY